MLTGYPAEIQQHLEDLSNLVVDALDPKAIYLLGSAARGELSWLCHPSGKIEFFSDYELAVITQHRPAIKNRHALQQNIRSFERQLSFPNPLFHIDILIRERHRLSKLPPIIFTYEMKQNALLLHGEGIRDEIPNVTLANLDFRNTHEILYKRLWAILLHLPKRFVLEQASKAERRVTGYILCRNALDLTTVFLPHEGVLLPTYRQRVAYAREHYADLQLANNFGSAFPDFLQSCLDRRIDLDFTNMDLHELYQTTLDYLKSGLKLLLPHSVTDLTALPKHSHHIFNEWPISRGEWYNLVRLTMKLARRHSPVQALKWLQLPKKGGLTLGLLSMHNALLAWFAGQKPTADAHLAESERILETLSFVPANAPVTGFVTRWLDLRMRWAGFWQQYIRLGAKPAKERIKRVMEWHYE